MGTIEGVRLYGQCENRVGTVYQLSSLRHVPQVHVGSGKK